MDPCIKNEEHRLYDAISEDCPCLTTKILHFDTYASRGPGRGHKEVTTLRQTAEDYGISLPVSRNDPNMDGAILFEILDNVLDPNGPGFYTEQHDEGFYVYARDKAMMLEGLANGIAQWNIPGKNATGTWDV